MRLSDYKTIRLSDERQTRDYLNKIRRFEDLVCWQKARALANTIHSLTLHPNFSKDFKLRDQILDAAGSVMHNIAEGQGDCLVDSDENLADLEDDLFDDAD